jgi:hypothetical protein
MLLERLFEATEAAAGMSSRPDIATGIEPGLADLVKRMTLARDALDVAIGIEAVRLLGQAIGERASRSPQTIGSPPRAWAARASAAQSR